MRRCRATEHKNSQAHWMLLPLLGERAGVMGNVYFNLIFGVRGSRIIADLPGKMSVVTSAATAKTVFKRAVSPLQLASAKLRRSLIWCDCYPATAWLPRCDCGQQISERCYANGSGLWNSLSQACPQFPCREIRPPTRP